MQSEYIQNNAEINIHTEILKNLGCQMEAKQISSGAYFHILETIMLDVNVPDKVRSNFNEAMAQAMLGWDNYKKCEEAKAMAYLTLDLAIRLKCGKKRRPLLWQSDLYNLAFYDAIIEQTKEIFAFIAYFNITAHMINKIFTEPLN